MHFSTLHDQDELFKTTLESLSHPFYIIDATTYEMIIGNSAAEIFGDLTPSTTCYAATHNRKRPCTGKSHICPLEEVKRTLKPAVVEHLHIDKDGQPRYLEIHAFPIFDADGNVTRMIEYSIDISGRKRAEEELRQSLAISHHRHDEITALLEGARAVLQHCELKPAAWAIFTYCKNLIGATAGYIALSDKERKFNHVLFLDSGGSSCTVDPSLPMPLRGLREKVFQTGNAIFENDFLNSEWVTYLPEGHAPLENVLFAPLKLDGIVVGLMGLAQKADGFNENDARLATAFGDLASIALQNSRYLESIQHREAQFSSITQTANDAVITINHQGCIIFWNRAAENIFGYTAEEILNHSITLIIPAALRKRHEAGLARVAAGGQSHLIGKSHEMIGMKKDGSELPIELSISQWNSKDEMFFTGIVRDITERKQAEQKIESLARFPSENPYPVLRVERDGLLIYANPASETFLRLLNCTVGEYLPPDWRERIANAADDTTHSIVEAKYNERIYLIAIVPIRDHGYLNLYVGEITERKAFEAALKQSHDELELRVQQRTKELEQANQALQAEIRNHSRADKARISAEKRLKEQQVRSVRSDRLRSLGEMAAGIAHELNQPLVGVRGLAEHVLIGIDRGWELTETALREKLSLIIEQADRMTHIIEHVRLFSKDAGKPIRSLITANEIIVSATALVRSQLHSRNIELHTDLTTMDTTISANPFSLEEVILNLIVNARDALEEKQKISDDSMDLYIKLQTSLESINGREWVTIRVMDNGLGMDNKIVAKIFEPFFTTKETDKATGLGLTISKTIVEQFEGTIDLQSAPMQGTTFKIAFPWANREE